MRLAPWVGLLLLGCPKKSPETAAPAELPPKSAPPPVPLEQRTLTVERMALAFPADRVKARQGWAADLSVALAFDHIPPTVGNVCAAVAIVEQESGYAADPVVPGIGRMVDAWIAEKQAELGGVKGEAMAFGVQKMLDTRPAGQSKSWNDRLHAARTEQDLDRTYRDFVSWVRDEAPVATQLAEKAASIAGYDVGAMNPITTAGCMQVKVEFAEDHAREAHDQRSDSVRDALYTRGGCLHYGTARLLGWEAGYDKTKYRFADYNAGLYSSRNAAFQEQIAAITGLPLTLDGDLVRYTEGGRRAETAGQTERALISLSARLGLTVEQISRDLDLEKDRAFEETATWAAVRKAYKAKTKRSPAYARLPDVTLDSPKLQGKKTTAWFADNVDKRYQACLTRLR